MRTPNTRRRPGFTLIEVLVAAGLCILIMTMMSVAFQAGLQSFSHLKSVGDLQERLRSAEAVIGDDLTADHFDGPDGKNKLSDQRLDLYDPRDSQPRWRPPAKGFFRVLQENPSTLEGTDTDGIVSTRATTHILHMSVKRSGQRADKTFTAGVPGNAWSGPNGNNLRDNCNASLLDFSNPLLPPKQIAGEWAEVAYFLDTTNQTGTIPGSNLPLYGLYRRTRVLATQSGTGLNWNSIMTAAGATLGQYQGMSTNPTTYLLNGPADVTNPNNRLGGMTTLRTPVAGTTPPLRHGYLGAMQDDSSPGAKGIPIGDDLVLANVISFEIKLTWTPNTFVANNTNATNNRTVPNPGHPSIYYPTPASKFEYPFDDLPVVSPNMVGPYPPTSLSSGVFPVTYRVFDTWVDTPGWDQPGANAVPLFMRVRAIQIKLRIYDQRNKIARQITLVREL